MHIRQSNTLSMYVTRVTKVVASWPKSVGQLAGGILVLVDCQPFVAWSAAACYAVGCHSTTACLLPTSNGRFIDHYLYTGYVPYSA